MAGPFDITSNEVQMLDDNQLRDVLRLLLEAEARQRNIPLVGISVGGNQNAADGGVDGIIEWIGDPDPADWIPCRKNIFQSKAEKMPASKLKIELAPKGVPRKFLVELAQLNGAYIIFSTDNCSNLMYSKRIDTMREVVAGVALSEQITFEFYDASRIATWVNCFHGVANEVRNFIGRPMVGWHPLENWSAPNVAEAPAYLPDDQPKATVDGRGLMAIEEVMNLIRERVSNYRSATRLIGLSGVGKTRFAQAIFDEQVGQNALNPAHVVYGDLSQSPAVTPTQIAEQLAHTQQDAVLIVDNCPGDTHRALSQITQRPGSHVGLLTIDFDVGSDQPENTLVFQLVRNGDKLIEALLQSRVPALTMVDRNRVVEFADGNARVALAIANNGGEGDSLAELTDQQLIDRLFLEGRRPNDDTLRRCAEVSSLVYAFHIEHEVNQEEECSILAELAEVSKLNFYRNIAECVERGMAQKRGSQRAILPHALAIHLAIRALYRLPPDLVLAHFNQEGRERLFKSFIRRLGSLHQSEPAQKIAQQLLAPDGLLGDLTTFTDNDFTLFLFVAPVIPNLALSALERAILGPEGANITSIEHPHRRELSTLARNIAYEVTYFDRAAHMLLAYAKAEPENHGDNPVRPQFFELFWIGLSGTQAPPKQRFRFLDLLLTDGDMAERLIAIQALSYALDTGQRSSGHILQFGTRLRGDEWHYKTTGELNAWFRDALRRLVPIACQGGELGGKALSAIAVDIRGLIRIGLADDVALSMRKIRERVFWPEGWKHLCNAMHYDRNSWPENVQEQMDQLEQEQRPTTTDEQFSIYVIGDPWGFHPPDPKDDDHRDQRMFNLAENLGREVGAAHGIWHPLAIRACAHNKSGSCRAFGSGLGHGVQDVASAWGELVVVFNELEPEVQNPDMLCGFLKVANEQAPDEVQGWLDEAVVSETLGPHIVDLSVSLPIDRHSIARLIDAVDLGRVPISRYRLLSFGRRTDEIPPDALANFLRELSAKGGEAIAITADIFHMYLFSDKQQLEIAPELINVGRELLQSKDLYNNISQDDTYGLGIIARRCLAGNGNEQHVRTICEMLTIAFREDSLLSHKLKELIRQLAWLHPLLVIDIALGGEESSHEFAIAVFGNVCDEEDGNGFPSINENTQVLLDWVNENPKVRAPRLAHHVRYLLKDDDGNFSWSLIASKLINLPDVGLTVLNKLYQRFDTGVSSGPWHLRYVKRRPLIETLVDHSDPSISAWAKNTLVRLNAYIEELINKERHRDERFE